MLQFLAVQQHGTAVLAQTVEREPAFWSAVLMGSHSLSRHRIVPLFCTQHEAEQSILYCFVVAGCKSGLCHGRQQSWQECFGLRALFLSIASSRQSCEHPKSEK